MTIKVFTMVKNENDIIEHWIKYHGNIFGYENLFIIDNESDDGTWEIILDYEKEFGINCDRHDNYKRKGHIMTQLIKNCGDYDIAFPLDIDEFIVYYDKEENRIYPKKTLKYFDKLIRSDNFKKNGVFKANYIQSVINNGNGFGYNDGVLESKYGVYHDYGKHAKIFVNKNWNDELDHGNHFPCNDYFLTDICLLHYHCRNLKQMKKKVIMNIDGLGYPTDDLKFLQNLDKDTPGYHHIQYMISILKDEFTINTNADISLDTNIEDSNKHICVSLEPLINFVKTL